MSHLAVALSKALEEMPATQAGFASRASLTRVQVNRAARGSASIGPEVVGKIVKALPSPHNAQVLAGWLRDEVPQGLSDLVFIEPSAGGVIHEAETDRAGRFDARRQRLLHWVEAQLPGTEFCDMLEAIRVALAAH